MRGRHKHILETFDHERFCAEVRTHGTLKAACLALDLNYVDVISIVRAVRDRIGKTLSTERSIEHWLERRKWLVGVERAVAAHHEARASALEAIDPPAYVRTRVSASDVATLEAKISELQARLDAKPPAQDAPQPPPVAQPPPVRHSPTPPAAKRGPEVTSRAPKRKLVTHPKEDRLKALTNEDGSLRSGFEEFGGSIVRVEEC